MYIGKNDEAKRNIEDYEQDGWNMKLKKERDIVNEKKEIKT